MSLPGRLVVPGGLRIDAASVRRLTAQLARSAADVGGVVAAVGPVPAGSSMRVHAERRSLLPLDSIVEVAGPSCVGAALVRPGVETSVDGHLVTLASGRVLVDPGALAVDPFTSPVPHAHGEAFERPPFPWRPVLVLVADEPLEPSRARWARDLANDLLDAGVEARLALGTTVPPPHLTGPVPGDDAVLVALLPEVLVALDPTALGRCTALAGLPRATTVVEAVDAPGGLSLVSWTIGRASGRLRARIGRDTGAVELADLARRLVAGPPPVAPAVTWLGDDVLVGLTIRARHGA